MTTQMIIALAITVFMIIIIMTDKLPFGASPLLACLLLVVFGITDIKGAFAGFSNATIVMLACSLFGTGSTAYYVLTIGLLSTLPYSKKLPPSKVIMTAGFAANHPLIPFNTALQYGIVIAVLNSAGVLANVSVAKFAVVNFFLSMGFLLNCLIQYKFLPDHPIAAASDDALAQGNAASTLPK